MWCKNEIQVLAQVFLKTPTLHAVTAEVIESNNRKKSQKDVVYFQPEDNYETWNKSGQKRKIFKKLHRLKHKLKMTFFKFSTLNRGGWNIGEKQWGKQSYLANSREDIREDHTILAYCVTDSLCSLQMYTIHQERLNAKWFTVISFNFGSFSQTKVISHAQ